MLLHEAEAPLTGRITFFTPSFHLRQKWRTKMRITRKVYMTWIKWVVVP